MSDSTSLVSVDVELIKYHQSFVAYIDVLGFREIAAAESTEIVSKYYSIIDESITNLKVILASFGKINTQIMSDSIVFSITPSTSDISAKIQCLRALCGGVSHLQFALSISGLWTRGGISFGSISFHDDRFVVGPALVRAVEMESIAIVPRVVLEPKILHDLGRNRRELVNLLNVSDTGMGWIFDCERMTSVRPFFEDLLFINFGINMANNFRYSVESAEMIAGYLKKGLYGPPKHLEKYLWLRDYLLSLPLKREIIAYFENT